MDSKYFLKDKASKDLFVSVISELFASKGKEIKFDIPSNPESLIDIFATAGTRTYAFELKGRRGRYVSDYYGCEGCEGWVLEDKKFNELMDAFNLSGYTPYYVNVYPDGVIRMWDVRNVRNDRGKSKVWTRYTDAPSDERYEKSKIELFNKDGKEFRFDKERYS